MNIDMYMHVCIQKYIYSQICEDIYIHICVCGFRALLYTRPVKRKIISEGHIFLILSLSCLPHSSLYCHILTFCNEGRSKQVIMEKNRKDVY